MQLAYTLGSQFTYDPYPKTVCLAAQSAALDAMASAAAAAEQ